MNISKLAYLTDDEPGIGGVLKERPEDFLVDEVPLYEPTGEGDHLYLIVEKRKRLTSDVARFLSQHFKVPMRAIGYAGLKDKYAITRQAFTLEHADADLAATYQDDYVKILAVDHHRHKIKRGHLAGNRFVIKVRNVEPTAVLKAKRLLDRLAADGAPNYIGEQRFGYRGDNHILGMCLITEQWQRFVDLQLGGPREHERETIQQARQAYDDGDYAGALELWPTVHRFERQSIGPLSRGASPADAVRGIDRVQRYLLISAWQSAIFNHLLHERITNGGYTQMKVGDVAFKHESRGVFVVDDVDTDQQRYTAGEISPSGPMWGHKMKRAAGAIAEREAQALCDSGVTEAQLRDGRYQPDGSRRPYRMLLRDPDFSGGVDEHGAYVRLAFELPRGCFATTVLREIMKTQTEPGRR